MYVRNRASQDGRLRVGSQLEFFFGAFEANLRNREAQGTIGFVKNGFGHRIFFSELFAHARVLRSLSGKHKCDFAHS